MLAVVVTFGVHSALDWTWFITSKNVQAYQNQVLNGMNTYNFKAVSQTYTSSASTDDYKITLH